MKFLRRRGSEKHDTRPRAGTVGWKEGDEPAYERDEKGVWVRASGGRYPIMQESDFLRFRSLADSTQGWTRRYAKNHVYAWDMPSQDKGESTVNVVRVWAAFEVPPYVMYDVLHDAQYRSQWDQSMIQGYNICRLDRCNDIGYYACKFPTPLKNRDFCNERSWRNVDDREYIIMNQSQAHADCPPLKQFIRARSIQSGYIIRQWGSGCCITYVSQSEPKGWIPTAVMNGVVTGLAPGIMQKLRKAAAGYVAWKSANNPSFRPWMSPPAPWSTAPGPGILAEVAAFESVSLGKMLEQPLQTAAWNDAPYGGQPPAAAQERPPAGAQEPPPAATEAAAVEAEAAVVASESEAVSAEAAAVSAAADAVSAEAAAVSAQ
eukprot:TRINITY_DN39869_c0_g1_i1.p1 TRINITY_DN39869_c0_g1~~TRINITY_DN39869_c0_g1_i1.p1  ORF type:complete len:375 (+),score=75.86 TRINITY_DN39869_c0_g1_i1:82-1206(+)